MNHCSPCRIEYDAYRTDLELLSQAPRTDINTARLEEAQQSYELHKVNFEKLRSDVSIKLKFLDENRVNCCGHFVHYMSNMYVVLHERAERIVRKELLADYLK